MGRGMRSHGDEASIDVAAVESWFHHKQKGFVLSKYFVFRIPQNRRLRAFDRIIIDMTPSTPGMYIISFKLC